jgi:predicted dithiol-disulfide oxidoreductase (DUF899 family)
LRNKIRQVRAACEPEEVPDYVFTNSAGSVRLTELFGDKPDLIVVHNMGMSCPSCTLWADGFNGIYDHLANRVSFVVSSSDAPALEKSFAASRGWRFPMMSHSGTTFAAHLGYRSEAGGWLPVLSVFRRDNNRILRRRRRRLAAELSLRLNRKPSASYLPDWEGFTAGPDLLPSNP